MKFLTVFTASLMPLTVISGIYGMNFEHMPELRRWWGYPLTLLAMVVASGSVLLFFRHRGWLGRTLPLETSVADPSHPGGAANPPFAPIAPSRRAEKHHPSDAKQTLKLTPPRHHRPQ
jgi:magnesium transporter